MMGMETSLIPYFSGQADEDSTLQVVSDATILTRWQANFWITGITKRLWDCIPCGVRTMLAWLERAGSSVLNILLFIHILPPLLLQTSLYLESWHFHFSVHFFFFLAAFWQFWLCHHAILGLGMDPRWFASDLSSFLIPAVDPALMVGPVADILAASLPLIRSVWRWSIYIKFPPKRWDVSFFGDQTKRLVFMFWKMQLLSNFWVRHFGYLCLFQVRVKKLPLFSYRRDGHQPYSRV